jgi:hypothetical protein
MRYVAAALVMSLGLTGWAFGAVDAEVSGGLSVSGDKKVNVSFFYEQLAPHGKWIEIKDHGWAWQPSVEVEETNWKPYMNEGHWVWTDYGWYWQSSYEWGWAPFHYGRWTFVDNYKWVWIPGEVWAPAWVTWRESDRYYGWAPLPPEVVFEPGVGLQFHNKRVEANFDFGLRENFFIFVPADHFLSENVATVVVAPTETTTIFRETKVVNNSIEVNNNRVINRGISEQRVAKTTGKELKPVQVTAANDPAAARAQSKGNAITAFKPEVSKEAPKSPKEFMNTNNTQEPKKAGAAADRNGTPQNTSVQQKQNTPANTNTNTTNAPKNDAQKSAEPKPQSNAAKPATPDALKNQTETSRAADEKARNDAAKASELKSERPQNTSVEQKRAEKPTEAQLKSAHERLEEESAKPQPQQKQAAPQPNNVQREMPATRDAQRPSSMGTQPSQGSQGPRPEPAPSQDKMRTERHEGPNATMNPAAPTPEMKTRTDTSPTKNDTEIKKQPEIR